MNVHWIKWMYFALMSLRLALMIVYYLVMNSKRCITDDMCTFVMLICSEKRILSPKRGSNRQSVRFIGWEFDLRLWLWIRSLGSGLDHHQRHRNVTELKQLTFLRHGRLFHSIQFFMRNKEMNNLKSQRHRQTWKTPFSLNADVTNCTSTFWRRLLL